MMQIHPVLKDHIDAAVARGKYYGQLAAYNKCLDLLEEVLIRRKDAGEAFRQVKKLCDAVELPDV